MIYICSSENQLRSITLKQIISSSKVDYWAIKKETDTKQAINSAELSNPTRAGSRKLATKENFERKRAQNKCTWPPTAPEHLDWNGCEHYHIWTRCVQLSSDEVSEQTVAWLTDTARTLTRQPRDSVEYPGPHLDETLNGLLSQAVAKTLSI